MPVALRSARNAESIYGTILINQTMAVNLERDEEGLEEGLDEIEET